MPATVMVPLHTLLNEDARPKCKIILRACEIFLKASF